MKIKLKRKLIIGLTILLIFLLSCNRKTKNILQTASGKSYEQIMELHLPIRNNYFAFNILRAIPVYDNNLVISPFSISTAMAMTYAGAAGKTKKEIAQTLFFDTNKESFHSEYSLYITRLREMAGDHVQLNIANNIWAQKDYQFLQEYFDLIELNYGTRLNQADFYRGDREQIRLDINQWVHQETREKISNLIAAGVLTEDTRLVLVNAIHFFGPWMTEFDKDLSRKDYFTNINGERKLTEFMFKVDSMPYFENEKMSVLELTYSGEDFSMLVFLPKLVYSLPELEKYFGANEFLNVLSELKYKEVEAIIPKFNTETQLNIEDLLAKIGMPLAFSNKADFSGMTGQMDLKIDKIIHKAMINVAEEGTEAAAATAVVIVMKTTIEPETTPRVSFKADRPFLYVIKDNRFNSILFIGRQVII